MSSAMDTTLRDETAYLEMVQDRNGKIQQLQKEMDEQKEKLERVQKQVELAFALSHIVLPVSWPTKLV